MITPEYAKWWQQQLALQSQAKQAAWQAQAKLQPWGQVPPGVNAPMANPLMSRMAIPNAAEADPGNAMAGYFMGNPDIASNPLLLHALLGSSPGLQNV